MYRWLAARTSVPIELACMAGMRGVYRWVAFASVSVVACIVGAMIAVNGASESLRLVVGLPAILMFLRYRYLLLLAWALVGVFVGSTLPFFMGNNLDTALTVPTLLALLVLPIRQTIGRMPALAFLSVFLLWTLAGIRLSPLDTASFLTLWTVFVDFLAIAVLTINVVTTRRRMLMLIDALLLAAAFIAVYGIYTYATHQNVQLDPMTGSLRIVSVFTAAPPLALFLSVVTPLAAYRAYTLRGLYRVAAAVLVIVLVVAIALTFTRAALVSLPISILVAAFALRSRTAKLVVLGGTVALVAALFLLTATSNLTIFGRFFDTDVSSLNGRTYLWRALLDHFSPTQLLGYGLRASDALLTSLHLGANGQIGNGLIATSPSNLFIGTLYDNGIIGVGLVGLVFVTLLASLIGGLRRAIGEHHVLFVMALAAYINMVIQSLDVNDFWAQPIGICFWIVMALPFAAYWRTWNSPTGWIEREFSGEVANGGRREGESSYHRTATVPG